MTGRLISGYQTLDLPNLPPAIQPESVIDKAPVITVSAYAGSKLAVAHDSGTRSTGDLPFVCQYGCGLAFNDRARRHRHIVQAHGYVPKTHKRQVVHWPHSGPPASGPMR